MASRDAATILNRVQQRTLHSAEGRGEGVQPLDLDAYPDVRAVWRAVDFERSHRSWRPGGEATDCAAGLVPRSQTPGQLVTGMAIGGLNIE